jgi:undecaprenyl phosphate-alpha-L-ara4N flippase subunit ArnE
MTEISSLHQWAGLIGTPFLIAAGQLLFKLVSARVGNADLHGLAALVADPLLIAALTIYGIATIVCVYVLKLVPLTLAYSFMGLTFVFVPVLAHLLLGEELGWRTAVGAGFIIAGLVIVNT